jgi:hypothetical protein
MAQDAQEKSIEGLTKEIEKRLRAFEASRTHRIDAMAISQTSKLPYKALLYREGLLWRMVELSRTAFETFEDNRLVSAILLTRAAIETSAALWYLCARLDASVQSGNVAEIDDCLMKLMMGTKTNLDIQPEAFNVLKFVDRMDKDVDGARHQYEMLSEFAHPNWAGTALLYSKHDPPNRWTNFGANIRSADSTKRAGLANLSVALLLFERSQGRLAEIMPTFVSLCESRLEGGGST